MPTIHLKAVDERGIEVVGHRDTVSKQWHEALVLGHPTTTFKQEGLIPRTVTVQPQSILKIVEDA